MLQALLQQIAVLKNKRLLYFTNDFISDHITIDNNNFFLSLCKTKSYNIKWNIMNFKKLILKIVRVIISMISLN